MKCNSDMSQSCKSCFPDSNNNTNCYGGQGAPGKGGYTGATPPMPPRKVQVTAKILFGSVSAITTMKNQEKAAKRKSQ